MSASVTKHSVVDHDAYRIAGTARTESVWLLVPRGTPTQRVKRPPVSVSTREAARRAARDQAMAGDAVFERMRGERAAEDQAAPAEVALALAA
jgi:hypothetical protein